MNTRHVLATCVIGMLAVSCICTHETGSQTVTASANEQKTDEWTSLFNGKSLSGWHVACLEKDKQKNYWKVTEGTIECDSMGDRDHNYVWLCSDREYDDFELKLKFQALRENKGNSGVQVRSRYDSNPDAPQGGWLDGPQIDIHPTDPWRNGLVYDETRDERGWIFPRLIRTPKKLKPEYCPKAVAFEYADEGDGWNDMHIICNGTKLTSIVNGHVVCDMDFAGILDSPAHKKYDVGMNGRIALQIHKKAEVKMRFKDIRIKEL